MRIEVVCIVCVIFAGCSSINSNKIDYEFEGRLLLQVEKAVENNISPEEIEEFVGIPSVFNTIRKKDREDLLDGFVEFGADETLSEYIPGLRKNTDMVIWTRTIEDKYHNLKLIGIHWDEEGDMKIFWCTDIINE